MPTPKPPKQIIDSLILAGGQSLRMGQTKALLDVQGKPLVAHLTDQLSPLCQRVFIAARDKTQSIQPFTPQKNIQFIDDYYLTDEGPLSAIASGLKHTQNEWLWVVSTDCFGDMHAVLSALLPHTSSPNNRILFLHHHDRYQPLQALIHKSLADDLMQWIERGERAVIPWYKKHQAQAIVFNQAHFYANLNSPKDYSGLLSHLSE